MRGQWKTLAALLCAALAMSAFWAGAAAAKAKPTAGTLDRSFGSGGRVLAPYTGKPAGYGAWIEAAASPGGATVVADPHRLLRYLPNGTLDPTFGVGGVAEIADPPGFDFEPSSLDVDSKGRPVLFGTAVNNDPASEFTVEGYVPARSRPSFAVVQRYGPGGALDPSFNGDGLVQTDFGLPLSYSLAPIVSATTGALDAEDRPVLVAARGEYVSPCQGHSYPGLTDTLVSRLNTDGQFDPTFGGGASIVPLGPGIVESVDLNFGPDGGPIVLGSRPPRYPCYHPQTAIVRMDVAGNPYARYGKRGLRYLSLTDPQGAEFVNPDVQRRSLAFDRQGRLLVLKGRQVLRLGADGRPDPKFGERGAVTIDLPAVRSGLTSLGVDVKGRILLSGTSSPSGADGVRRPNFVALRLRPSGKPDPTFGQRGQTLTGFGAGSKGRALDGFVDGRGRLLVAGWATGPGLESTGAIGLARYVGG